MKTKVVFEFNTVDALHAFDREVYIKGKFHKKQWSVPTIMKMPNGRYAIEYCVGRITAMKLTKEREHFGTVKELMYKNIKVESLV